MSTNKYKTISAVGLVLLSAAGLVFVGCKSSSPNDKTVKASIFPPAPEQSGAQIWADNCSRCHNIRPPDYYSSKQWEVIVNHMRLRANLTGQEARKVTEFLQAAAH